MHTVRTLLAAAMLVALAGLPAIGQEPAVDAPQLDVGCAPADVAGSLISDSVTSPPVTAIAAGRQIAVVTDPAVPPGIPHALLATPAGLCTVETFNLTVAPELDLVAAASTFASTAGMPWLGQVDITDVRVAGDGVTGHTVTMTTHGGRHGVTSDWTIALDASGIRTASFTTTAFGEGLDLDDAHHIEGITSLPGHSRTWVRDAGGLLRVDATVADQFVASSIDRDAAAAHAARIAGLAPGDFLEQELDGQIVRFTVGIAGFPVETVATGVDQADRLLYMHEGMGRIYDQYASWGATDVWGSTSRTVAGFGTFVPDEVGYINFNSGMSEVCLACAYLGDFIEIHVNLHFAEATENPIVLGVDYPNDNSYMLEVLGHEFTHAVQGGYGDGNVGLTNAFYEATATASQTLFHEAENSAQRGSIEFLDSANGCEGFENGRGGWINAQAAGPFTDGHTYDACYFWWTYMASHGGEGLVDLMEALPGVDGEGESSLERHLLHLDLAASDGDGTADLARWAAAYTAGVDGDGYTIEDGSGDVHDWFALLTPAERSRAIGAGQSVDVTAADGGTLGFTITSGGVVAALPAGADAHVFDLRDGHLDLAGIAVPGTAISAGQILTIVAPAAKTIAGPVALT